MPPSATVTGSGIVIRPDDLVVLGVQWLGLDPVPATPGQPPAVQAPAGSGGQLIVAFPPQHVAEETSPFLGECSWPSLGHSLPPGAPVAVLDQGHARTVFTVDDDRMVHQHPQIDASGNGVEGPDVPVAGFPAPPGAHLAAVSTDGQTVDLWAVIDGGPLCHRQRGPDGNWTDWAPIDGTTFPPGPFDLHDATVWDLVPGTRVAAKVVQGSTWLFWPSPPNPAGTVSIFRRHDGAGAVSPTPLPADTRLTSVLVAAGFEQSLFAPGPGIPPPTPGVVVLCVGADGRVKCVARDAEWTDLDLGAPPAGFPTSATVLAGDVLDPNALSMAVLAVGNDGVLYGRWWSWQGVDETGRPWTPLGDVKFTPGSGISEDVFGVSGVNPDGEVQRIFVARTDPLSAGKTSDLAGGFTEHESLGDWCPPNGEVSSGYLVAADRTIRIAVSGGTPFADLGRRAATIAGPSRLAFAIPPGGRVTLSAQGVLAAMREHPIVAEAGASGTSIELPWGLLLVPDGSATQLEHTDGPGTGVAPLWRTRASGDSVPLRSLGVTPDPAAPAPTFAPPLAEHDRTAVHQHASDPSQAPIAATRLGFSALGGWLTAVGAWPDFSWRHLAVCGRDLEVRTVTRGILYPLGHAAEFEEVTVRRFDTRSDRSAAELHRHGTLYITEPVRTYGDQGTPDFRRFPFATVEIAATSLTGLDAPPAWVSLPRPIGPGSWEQENERLENALFNTSGDEHLRLQREQVFLLDNRTIDTFFQPTIGGAPVRFPVRLGGGDDSVLVHMPQLFVTRDVREEHRIDLGGGQPPIVLPAFDSFTADGIDDRLRAASGAGSQADVPGLPIRLAGTEPFEVHGLTLAAPQDARVADGVRPLIAAAEVALPAMRQLGGEVKSYAVTLADEYVVQGSQDVVLRIAGNALDVAFGGTSARSGGLARPAFSADAISAAAGPVKAAAVDPASFFTGEAKLLGMVALRDVVAKAGFKAPSIASIPVDPGLPPKVTLEWDAVPLGANGAFQPSSGHPALLTLTVESTPVADGPPRVHTTGELRDFQLEIAGVLVVAFRSVRFESKPDEKPTMAVDGPDVDFAGDLHFLDVLKEAISAVAGDLPVAIDATPDGVTIEQNIGLDAVSLGAGAFTLTIRDAVFHTKVTLPFDGEFEVALSVGTKPHPFLVGVWILGGGGYLELTFRGGTLELAASVEIGGLWSLDWVVVAGEVHALAGIEIRLVDGHAQLSGYLRIGGSVQVLKLISVSLEVTAEITAGSGPGEPFRVVASASIVLEVDLFLASFPLELHQSVVLYEAGGEEHLAPQAVRAFLVSAQQPQALASADARAAWLEFRRAFA